jgi:hypothetical protein
MSEFDIVHFSHFNPLPLLFKALLHGQKDRVFFFQQAFNLHTKTSAL